MKLPFIIVGNPENRRVTGFAAALADQGWPAPAIVSWLSIAKNGVDAAFAAVPDGPAFLRIDSFGENPEVEAELLRLGLDDAEAAGVSTINYPAAISAVNERGRIICPRQAHFGFLRLLTALDDYFRTRPNWVVLNQPKAIADLFDKRKTSVLYAKAGLNVPRAIATQPTTEALRDALRQQNLKSAYVKLSCGSSASCLAIVQHDYAMTTVELAGDKLFNSRVVRRVDKPRELEKLVNFLLTEGSQVEAAVPKARIDDHYFDLRILVIDREPAFTVMRQSRHLITNLHLGGRRGDLASLDRVVPKAKLAEARAAATRVSEQHDTQHVGVDVLLETKTFDPYVLEANAFGDLLPGLPIYQQELARARHS